MMLMMLLNLQKGAVVIIDAFDIALCDDFVKKLIIFLRENLNGQLIITTCNKLVTKIDIPQENIYFQVLSNVEIVDVLYVDERQDTAKNGFVMLRIGKVWLHVIFEIFMK